MVWIMRDMEEICVIYTKFAIEIYSNYKHIKEDKC